MQQLTLARAVVVLVGLLGSSSAAQEQVDFFRASDYHLPFSQRLQLEVSAPIIVLGKVIEVSNIGQPKRSQGDPRILIQLTRLTVDVEEVLKGAVRTNPMEIDLFTYSSANLVDLGLPRYIPMVGQQRIYFLRSVENAYRSVGDVTNYNLAVQSGVHERGFCKGKKPGCCIAEILLVPGPNFDPGAFAAHLYESEYVASRLCSRSVARNLLARLGRNSNEQVAADARKLLESLSSPGQMR